MSFGEILWQMSCLIPALPEHTINQPTILRVLVLCCGWMPTLTLLSRPAPIGSIGPPLFRITLTAIHCRDSFRLILPRGLAMLFGLLRLQIGAKSPTQEGHWTIRSSFLRLFQNHPPVGSLLWEASSLCLAVSAGTNE